MKTRRTILAPVLLALALVAPELAPAYGQLAPGDLLVADAQAGTNKDGALFGVNLSTGSRSIIHDFGAGPNPGADPIAVAVAPSGNILVLDFSAGTNFTGALFSVNAVTGARAILSDLGNPAQGPTGFSPLAMALDATANIFVLDSGIGTGGNGSIIRIDPSTGARMIMSDFGNPAQGATAKQVVGMAIDPSGNLFVTALIAGVPTQDCFLTSFLLQMGCGALFRVNPSNGVRTVISDFGNAAQGPTGREPGAVAVDPSGNVLVLDLALGNGNNGSLFRIDPSAGSRRIISDFGNSTQGPTGSQPTGLAIDSSGNILVTAIIAGTFAPGCAYYACGALFRVDPTTGSRTLLSDFGSTRQGPAGVTPMGMYLVGETRPGSNVSVGLPQFPGARLTYSSVTRRGITSATALATGDCLRTPASVLMGTCLSFSFTSFAGNVTVTLPYDPSLLPSGRQEAQVRLFQIRSDGSAQDVTIGVDTVNKRVTGRATSLGAFVPGLGPAQATTTRTSTTATTQPRRGCLIATAAYGSGIATEVKALRTVRDQAVSSLAGRRFLEAFDAWYYSFSESFAPGVASNDVVRSALRVFMLPLIGSLALASSIGFVVGQDADVAVLVSGIAASSLVGILYASPVALAVLALSRRKKLSLTAPAAAWAAAIASAIAASLIREPNLTTISTAILAVTTVTLSAAFLVYGLLRLVRTR